MTLQTRAVLAAAYVTEKTCLTHAVEVDARGIELRVLCRRVKLGNIADKYSGDVDAPPTCPICAKRAEVLRRAGAL